MIKVGIIGGAGYTAGELIRVLLHHPMAVLVFVQSSSHSGQAITKVHRDLLGETELIFTDALNFDIDVLFLCSGHGKSKLFLQGHKIPQSVKIIDLSNDFRIEAPDHTFVYGLPEANKEMIAAAHYIANPGCFATAIELAFLPLVANKLLTDELHVTAITGSTGAGQMPTSTSHFSWKNNNVSVYKAFEHQHLAEIKQTLQQKGKSLPVVNFIPVRGNFTRGIMAICYTNSSLNLDEARMIYQEFYRDQPFVVLSEENPNVKQVVNTNKCVLYLEKHGGKLMIISVIDNLLKGASGQAIQNMNLLFGLDERTGLQLKPVAF
ncbi:MAG: N-acetyl-gamma-glutamyl-phosphate reductase [Bacteroidetes bacterium HGW-Bacteroidetes-4]|jgi:N-acetyl-gamma-glutamyl-phosphate reductase|nr:MAG: N-acetyl-gamma-glutamyl-phosphate reductase [Bacteroidetes bacterium HGW-Bacteroidetes-4]